MDENNEKEPDVAPSGIRRMLKDLPDTTVPWSDPRLRAGYLAILVAGILGLLLLPRVMINQDEYIYAGEAKMLVNGHLAAVDGDPLPGAGLTADYEGPRYPPGWPLVLAFGALWSFRAMFVVALLAHLLGGAAMARLMVRRGLPSILAAVWLFHPLFWSFSRTLMSDVPAAVLLLIVMDAWENGQTKTAAVATGYSFLLRMASFTHVAGFALAVGKGFRHKVRTLGVLALGAAGGVIVLLLINTLKHGHPFRSPYAATNQGLLTVGMLGQNFWVYGLGLLLIPPFPLVWILFRPRVCDRWALVAVPVIAFFLLYGYRDQSPRFIENLLGGQRLILAAHAALLVATAGVWSRIPLARNSLVLLIAGILGVFTHHVAVRHLDLRYGPAAQAVAACHPESVIFNQYASRVALSTDASSYHLFGDREPTVKPDVAVMSLRQPTNKYETPVTFQIPEWLRRYPGSCRRFGDFFIFDFAGRCPTDGNACNLHISQAKIPKN
jgi:hypothetical protein